MGHGTSNQLSRKSSVSSDLVCCGRDGAIARREVVQKLMKAPRFILDLTPVVGAGEGEMAAHSLRIANQLEVIVAFKPREGAVEVFVEPGESFDLLCARIRKAVETSVPHPDEVY